MTLAFSILINLILLLPGGSKLNKTGHLSPAVRADTVLHKLDPKVTYQVPNVPKLFYVQRSPNTNTIVYDVNVDKKGQLNADDPISIYWIRYNEQGQKATLSYIQRKFAYGLTAIPLGNDKYDIRIVAYKKYPLLLMRWANDNKYHIFATVEKKEVILNKIFLKIEGGSMLLPNVVYVEVTGTDPATGKELTERFKP